MATSDEFVIDRTLGEGAFGKVFLVTGSDDKKKYAMKVINLKTAPDEERELAVREAQLLKDLAHDNVLKYIDSFESDGALCIVTEFCGNGDLSEFLDRRNKTRSRLEEDQLTEWFRQIASALEYLHGRKIVHRDVKTPNVFLTENWNTKLGDMGLAKVLEKPSQKAVTFCGSPYYMSPEIFSCKPYDSKSDVWALGVIVYEMATLERPFDATLMHQLVFKIVHGDLPEMPKGYSDELPVVLKMILQRDPEKRPTASEVLQHGFFKGSKPPPLPPRPVPGAGASGFVQSRYRINRPMPGQAHKENHKAGPFDMDKIMNKFTSIRMEDAGTAAGAAAGGALGGDTPVKGLGYRSILNKQGDGGGRQSKSKFRKDVTIKPSPRRSTGVEESQMSDTVTSMSDVKIEGDWERTLTEVQNETASAAINVMQMIVRTMTGLYPNEKDERDKSIGNSDDPQAVMLRQIEHLQYYCTRVLGDDVALFGTVYDLISREKDEHKLEEQLISVLGPEKFGLCGVHLMFLKNFEYNLQKLHE